MPSSMPYGHSFILKHAIDARKVKGKAQPLRSLLDVGIGSGKWSLLFREYLEMHYDKVFPDQWRMVFHGVEIFKPYVQKFPWIKHTFRPGRIIIGDIYKVLRLKEPKLHRQYDIIMAGDVIEHLDKDRAAFTLRRLVSMARRLFLLSIPLGKEWMGNKIVADNEWEHHRSTWEFDEVLSYAEKDMGVDHEVHNFARGPIGVFAFMRPGVDGVRK